METENGTTRPSTMVVSEWRPFPKGALLGFFSVELPSGMVLRDCSLMEKDGPTLGRNALEEIHQSRWHGDIHTAGRFYRPCDGG